MQSDEQMTAFVIDLLKRELPATYYYHDPAHTLYVLDKIIDIAEHENCTKKEIALLKTAALWHDVGFITIYYGHEKASCTLAKKYLPGYGYSDDDIHKICGMIMATKMPQSPHNKLEEIIADADLEYLGTKNAAVMAERLFRELHALDPGLTKEQWHKQQITFLQHHDYFTRFCKENRGPVKSAYLKELKDKI